MATSKPRFSITLLPEWIEDLDKLKKEKFYKQPYSIMIRELIAKGLEQLKIN